MRVTTINSGKGGSLKSTTAWALATWLYKHGYQPLVIDYEPNANVSAFMGADYRTKPTMFHVLNGEVAINEAIQKTAQGYIIAGNATLNKIVPLYYNEVTAGIKALKNQMAELEKLGFSHVIIDNQPLVGSIQTLQATTAANDMIITLHPDSATLQGLISLLDGLKEAREWNQNLRIDGFLLGRDKGTNNEKFFAHKMRVWAGKLQTRVYSLPIREGIAVQEAQGNVVSLWDDYKKQKPARDYENFILEYMES